MLDNAFVLGRAAGFKPGVGRQCAIVDDARALLIADRMLRQGA